MSKINNFFMLIFSFIVSVFISSLIFPVFFGAVNFKNNFFDSIILSYIYGMLFGVPILLFLRSRNLYNFINFVILTPVAYVMYYLMIDLFFDKIITAGSYQTPYLVDLIVVGKVLFVGFVGNFTFWLIGSRYLKN